MQRRPSERNGGGRQPLGNERWVSFAEDTSVFVRCGAILDSNFHAG